MQQPSLWKMRFLTSGKVIGHYQSLANSAATASNVAEQVTSAVEDISRGAASQAENVENSVNNTNEMGNSIDDITERVEDLTAAANDMLTGANRTVDTFALISSAAADLRNMAETLNEKMDFFSLEQMSA